MNTVRKNKKIEQDDCYDPELDKYKNMGLFLEKLEKAKVYFREHGLPDIKKVMKDVEEKQLLENAE